MKRVSTALAIIGVFIIVGALGHDDVMVMSHTVYSIFDTLKTMLIGFVLCVPAIVRGVYGKRFS